MGMVQHPDQAKRVMLRFFELRWVFLRILLFVSPRADSLVKQPCRDPSQELPTPTQWKTLNLPGSSGSGTGGQGASQPFSSHLRWLMHAAAGWTSYRGHAPSTGQAESCPSLMPRLHHHHHHHHRHFGRAKLEQIKAVQRAAHSSNDSVANASSVSETVPGSLKRDSPLPALAGCSSGATLSGSGAAASTLSDDLPDSGPVRSAVTRLSRVLWCRQKLDVSTQGKKSVHAPLVQPKAFLAQSVWKHGEHLSRVMFRQLCGKGSQGHLVQSTDVTHNLSES